MTRFDVELARLLAAAGSPGPSDVRRLCLGQRPPIDLPVQTLSDWFNGRAVNTRRASTQLKVIELLEGRAQTVSKGQYQPRGRRWWAELRIQSRETDGPERDSDVTEVSPDEAGVSRWSLANDREARRHWLPRGRGVAVDSERGFRFRGRRHAIAAITQWLDRPVPDRKVLVVTGSPGSGKSALLARVVSTADADYAMSLPPEDMAGRATVGSVACAVHAKGKSAHDVAAEIMGALGRNAPDRVEDFAILFSSYLQSCDERQFNIVIDALDEAASPAEARTVLSSIVLPIATTCSHLGAKAVVGSRRFDGAGDLLRGLGASLRLLDLDSDEYFTISDLVEYVLATLQLSGDERPDSPYSDATAAQSVAVRIADLADQNFLIAGLIARSHGLYDTQPAVAAEITFTADVGEVLSDYLSRMTPLDDGSIAVADLMTALAFAEAPGLTLDLWRSAIRALTGQLVAVVQLARFAAGPAASFLIEFSDSDATRSYRLFHQALNDALLEARDRIIPSRSDEQALTRSFLSDASRSQWRSAPQYLLRSLPGHAGRAGLLNDLLTDDEYLLYADLRRIKDAIITADTSLDSDRAKLLRLTPSATTADPAMRAALFSVTESVEGLTPAFRTRPEAPYSAIWAAASPRSEQMMLEGHSGAVEAVCSVDMPGHPYLASAGADRAVRIWDPATGELQHTLAGHTDLADLLCAVEVEGGHSLLASGGYESTIRIWDPATGELLHTLEGHTGSLNALCAVEHAGRSLLASAGYDGVVRMWDPVDGQLRRSFGGKKTGSIRALCTFKVAGKPLLASVGQGGAVWIWDVVDGKLARSLKGPLLEDRDPVDTLCAFEGDGRILLATAGSGRRIQIWDPATGALKHRLDRSKDFAEALCPIVQQGRVLLAATRYGRSVRIWDTASGSLLHTLDGHQGAVRALCTTEVAGQSVLATAGYERSVRIWDATSGQLIQTLDGHIGSVRALTAVEVSGQALLATAGRDSTVRIWNLGAASADVAPAMPRSSAIVAIRGSSHTILASAGHDHAVRLWNAADGELIHTLDDGREPVETLCAAEVGGRTLLVTAGGRRMIQVWDPAIERRLHVLEGSKDFAGALSALVSADRTLLAAAGRTVRIWDLADGQLLRTLDGHTAPVEGLCVLDSAGRQLLATADGDRTVRVWDALDGHLHRRLVSRVDGERRYNTGPGLLCSLIVAGRSRLANVGRDNAVRVWDPGSGELLNVLEGNGGPVTALCAIDPPHGTLLASADEDEHLGQVVRTWDPASGELLHTLVGHSAPVRSMCAIDVGARTLLASGGDDRTVRIWDPATGDLRASVPVGSPIFALHVVDRSVLTIGLSGGLLCLGLRDLLTRSGDV